MEFQKQSLIEFLNIALQITPGSTCGPQAREVNKLPKSYDGLTVKASVGMGVATEIPWVTFTGYNQKTSDGIYPVLLFYHEKKILVVAFGVSATNIPKESWDIPGLKTLDQYFTENNIPQTRLEKKYNASFVHSVFPVHVTNNKVDESRFNVDSVFDSLSKVCKIYKNHFEGRTTPTGNMKFTWIPFYKEFSQKLLKYRNNRTPLINWIYDNLEGYINHFKDGTDGRRVPDTDPFTVFALINRGITSEKKKDICAKFKVFMNISTPVPEDFTSVPEMNNQKSNFMAFEDKREEGDIERLWKVFEDAVFGRDIEKSYNALSNQYLISKNLTIGLFWIRPDKYLALDGNSCSLLKSFGIATVKPGFVPYDEYRDIMKRLDAKMESGELECTSYPEFSLLAYKQNDGGKGVVPKSKELRYWLYAPGPNASKWPTCMSEGIMSIGWDDLGDLTNYSSREEMQEAIKTYYSSESSGKNDSLAVWQFTYEMKPGDIVFVKKGRNMIIGKGVVESDYEFDDSRDDYKHIRKVRWTEEGEWEYPQKLPMKTLTLINSYREMIERLEGLFDSQETIEQIPFSMSTLYDNIKKTGLLYEEKLIQRYVCSLMTKPFVILSGLAGSGKTQLALAFARAMSENVDQQLCVVPVGADWTNREPLLGYPNALKPEEYMLPESGALQILMRALRNPNKPYFLVLDEMNLSYVERYFADFLSALESHQEIPLWEKPDECDSEVPAKIALPKNLFIIGTINVDETTYMFSPKVLDRANVIEFKISEKEMDTFLKQDMNVDLQAADGLCANMGQDFAEKSTRKETESSELAQKTLISFFKVLKKVNAEFGYRSATEIYRFIANAKALAKDLTEDEILDAAIVQKLLPKLHGSRKKLEPALKALWGLCMQDEHTTEAITRENLEYARFPESADKIQRMMQTALDNGFTSFAEA